MERSPKNRAPPTMAKLPTMARMGRIGDDLDFISLVTIFGVGEGVGVEAVEVISGVVSSGVGLGVGLGVGEVFGVGLGVGDGVGVGVGVAAGL